MTDLAQNGGRPPHSSCGNGNGDEHSRGGNMQSSLVICPALVVASGEYAAFALRRKIVIVV